MTEKSRTKQHWIKKALVGGAVLGAIEIGLLNYFFKPKQPAQIFPQQQTTITARENPRQGLEKEVVTQEAAIQKAATQEIKEKTIEQTASIQITQDQPKQNPLEKKVNAPEIIDSSREVDALALAIYGEARRELCNGYNDYVYGVARSAITRASLRGDSIEKIVLKANKNKKGVLVNQYTCFSKKDVNYDKINSPDKEVLARCREVAEDIVKERVKGCPELKKVTNYYVGKQAVPGKYKTLKQAKEDKIPAWAFVNNGGDFMKDNKGYLIPRKPVAVTDVWQTKHNGDRAFFYYSKYF